MIIDERTHLIDLETHFDSGVFNKLDLMLVRGEGARAWDHDGREYIDCIGGVGVASVGHCHPDVVHAIQTQATRLLCSPQFIPNDQRAHFLAELTSVLPAHLNRVFLGNSGAEANEAAIKFAVAATGRSKLLALQRGFGGRTLGALALTYEPHYREPFAPVLRGQSDFLSARSTREDLERLIDDTVAAVFIEPVQGESGVRPLDPTFVRALRDVTREKGALLIVDEIQTGFCRTGKFFGFEHFDIEPDGVTLAKAIAGGLPCGAFVTTADVADRMPKGGHGSTFGGNPLVMAAGAAAIRVMKRERLWSRADELGAHFRELLKDLRHPTVRDVRGLGLMIGIELKCKAAPVLKELRARGVLAAPASSNVVRLLPPLVITPEEIATVVHAVRDSLNAST